jgi:hypothetical protein
MTDGAFFWILLFSFDATVFFGIALVVAIRGVSNVRDLLLSSEKHSPDVSKPPAER